MKQDKAVRSVIKSQVSDDKQEPFNGFTAKFIHGQCGIELFFFYCVTKIEQLL